MKSQVQSTLHNHPSPLHIYHIHGHQQQRNIHHIHAILYNYTTFTTLMYTNSRGTSTTSMQSKMILPDLPHSRSPTVEEHPPHSCNPRQLYHIYHILVHQQRRNIHNIHVILDNFTIHIHPPHAYNTSNHQKTQILPRYYNYHINVHYQLRNIHHIHATLDN